MQGWKMQDWNYRHQTAGVENAGLEISEPCYRGWKMRDQAVMESQTPTCYGTRNMIYLIFRPPGTVVPGGLMFCCVFFFFCGTLRRYISEMAGAIALKLSHMIGSVGT